MKIFRTQLATILVTVIVTSLMWVVPMRNLTFKIASIQKEVANTSKDTVAMARKIKNSEYTYEEYIVGCEDQIEELQNSLWGKDNRIETLERQLRVIRDSYEKKLENSEIVAYHLSNTVLSAEQLEIADTIAHTVANNYEEYGVLPSVAVGQAMQESQLGKRCPKNNLWGISTGGYASYNSLEDGIFSYMKCLNNGYYDKALFQKDYKTAMYHIQNGGYCQPKNGYANKVISCIEKYSFKEYDDYYLGLIAERK